MSRIYGSSELFLTYFRFSVVLKDSDKLVFALLRKSLDVGYEIDSRLLVSADWGAVFDMCVAHGVAGICFGAVESLPKGCRPGVEAGCGGWILGVRVLLE